MANATVRWWMTTSAVSEARRWATRRRRAPASVPALGTVLAPPGAVTAATSMERSVAVIGEPRSWRAASRQARVRRIGRAARIAGAIDWFAGPPIGGPGIHRSAD